MANARILAVDDSPTVLEMIKAILVAGGYDVITASDGAEALETARAEVPDLILLDVMLPKLDGWEVLGRLRKQKSTPVLMLTARDSHADRVRGLDTGADDYVPKPFDLKELLARLRALIRRSANRTTNKIVLGDVELDMRSRTTSRAGQPVILTAREYAILEYLALHRGKVISRTQLYEHLFDENDDTLSNLVDVHIFSIRKKLGQNVIATRRGQGYCIE